MESIEVTFPDKEGKPVLAFCDFRSSPSSALDWVLVRVAVDHCGFMADHLVEIERHELELMRTGLEQMMVAWGAYAIQLPLCDRLQLSFHQDATGGIQVHVLLQDTLNTTTLQVRYASERFFVQEAIGTLTKLLEGGLLKSLPETSNE